MAVDRQPTRSSLEVAVDQFLMRLGYTHDSTLDEVAEEIERLRLTASNGQRPND